MSGVAAEQVASAGELARALWRLAVLRGIAAFVLGAYVFVQEPASAPAVARASAVYWLIDGLTALRASRFAETIALSRIVFLVRGGIAIAAGLVVLGLPLKLLFGPWKPGQLMYLVLVASLMLAAVGCQVGAAAFDVMIWLAIRHRIAGEWSWVLGGAFSAALALIAALIFAAPAVVVGRIAIGAAMVAALGFVLGAVAAGDRGTASVAPAPPRKH